jgi:hypothetical protein
MKEQPTEKPFKDITPEDIKQECKLVSDLSTAAELMPSIEVVALLVASMIVEKTLRHILYAEYKTITKIKFSVLIDKAFQKGLIDLEEANQFRVLKNFRNASVHHGLMNIPLEKNNIPVTKIIQQIHDLLNNFSSTKDPLQGGID